MNILLKDPWQQAAEEAGGFEGLRLQHNCKESAVLLDGGPVDPDFRACFLMSTAKHGWVQFGEDGKLVDSEILSFDDVAPDREKMDLGHKPNTSCLCVAEGVGLMTYAGASWAVRKAFMAQLLKPYARIRKLGMFPLVRLGFRVGQKDEHGNGLPYFGVVEWVPRARFASILGEPNAPAPALQGPQTIVTSGIQRDPRRDAPPIEREAPPPIDDPGVYGGGPSWDNDDIPFAPYR